MPAEVAAAVIRRVLELLYIARLKVQDVRRGPLQHDDRVKGHELRRVGQGGCRGRRRRIGVGVRVRLIDGVRNRVLGCGLLLELFIVSGGRDKQLISQRDSRLCGRCPASIIDADLRVKGRGNL